MIYFTAALKTPSIPTLEETQAIVQEVHEDLQQLKPNAILETIRSWAPGLLSLHQPLSSHYWVLPLWQSVCPCRKVWGTLPEAY